jgi:hypothetical protein
LSQLVLHCSKYSGTIIGHKPSFLIDCTI